MEIFGGFMVMLGFLGFFLTVIWFVMPFVVFAVKGRLDRAIDQLEGIDRRLAAIEALLAQKSDPIPPAPVPSPGASEELPQ